MKSEEFRWILRGFRSVEPNNTPVCVMGRDDFAQPLIETASYLASATILERVKFWAPWYNLGHWNVLGYRIQSTLLGLFCWFWALFKIYK